jgi:hypothetical protein
MSVAQGNYYLNGYFDASYVVNRQAYSTFSYGVNCVSSNGQNMISIQGTYPNNTIYYSKDYGQSWALSNAPTTMWATTCSPVNYPNVFYIGAINGGFKLCRSMDGGATWTLISTAYTNIAGMCVSDDDSIFYLSNYGNAMYYSTRAGNTLFNYTTNTGSFTFSTITSSNNSYSYGQCLCSPDGQFLYGTSTGSNRLFTYNFSNTASFNITRGSTFNNNFNTVAMSSNGSYLFAGLYLNASYAVIRSIDGGANFSAIGTGVITNNSAPSIFCSPTGQYVQVAYNTSWWISTNYGTNFSVYSGGAIPSAPPIFNNNQFILLVLNTTVQYGPVLSYPCFLEGTKILRMNAETDTEEYVPVETLRRGDLIKTAHSGYKAVQLIGHKTIQNSPDSDIKNRLFLFKKSDPMTEDVCVTGEHCTLHKSLDSEKFALVRNYMGDVYITEDYYRVPAHLDERSIPYETEGEATIWHFALEHENEYWNYGVFANGLLVESCSVIKMAEFSNMTIL